MAIAFLWVAYALPAILIGPFAAAYVDIADRKKVLIFTNLLQSALIFAFALSQSLNTFLIYGIVIFYSSLNQFYVPAEFAALPTLVRKRNYSLANGLFFLTQQAALVIGFGAAGLLYEKIGVEHTLFLCAGMLFIAFLNTAALPTLNPRQKVPRKFEELLFAFFEKIAAGYRFIKSSPRIYIPFIYLIGLQALAAISAVVAPVLATDVFRIPVYLVGLFVAVPAALGAIVGSLIVSKLLKKGQRKIASLKISSALFVMAFGYMALLASRLMLIPRLMVGALALALLGFGFVGMIIPLQTYLQEITPPDMRGRVFGNIWFLMTIASVIPTIMAGTIAEIFSINLLLFVVAVVFGVIYFMIDKHGANIIKNKF